VCETSTGGSSCSIGGNQRRSDVMNNINRKGRDDRLLTYVFDPHEDKPGREFDGAGAGLCKSLFHGAEW